MVSSDTYPRPSSTAATAVMRGNRRRDTRPERALRSILHRSGRRFRVDWPIDTGGFRVRPDIVFTRSRVAVFVDGCFWHACPEHGTTPRVNTGYWGPKLNRNVARDRLIDERLGQSGWQVFRVWEHEDPQDVASRLAVLLDRSSAG